MFLIGTFSKIAQVSMRMLRHYDEIGLFRPERVDPDSGYRYYSARQLPEINRIVALKMLGLGLEEVRRIVKDGISAAELGGIYRAQQANLESAIAQQRRRLALVESRLRQLDEDALEGAEVVLKSVPDQMVVSLRETAPDFAAMGALMRDAVAALRGSAADFGPCLAVFYDPHFEQDEIDWEFGAVLEGDDPGTIELAPGRCLVRRRLPGLELCATTIHLGPYPGLHLGYSALGAWIEANGYALAGPGREVFWHLDEEQSQQHVTEIQFPVLPP